MATASKIGSLLHEEHFWAVVLVNGLETQLGERRSGFPIDPKRPADRAHLEEIVELLDAMLRHHAFEERVLFPLIRDRGNAGMIDLFADEHAAMGPFIGRLRRITLEILEHGMTDARLQTFGAALAEFSEYIMLHIQKEELTIVQKLDALIDAETDEALASKFAEQKAAAAKRAAE